MYRKSARRVLSFVMSLVLASSCILPSFAYAAESVVRIEDHAPEGVGVSVSKLSIGGVDAPKEGEALDDTATVKTSEGESWDIPVLWIGGDLQLATQAEAGRSYLPALAFFLPADFTVQDVDETGGFDIALEDDLVKLFKSNEIVSVYDKATGITYILPASLRYYFGHASQGVQQAEDAGRPTIGESSSASAPVQKPEQKPEPEKKLEPEQKPQPEPIPEDEFGPDDDGLPKRNRLIDIYCAKTAQDAFTDDDLTYLIDLIVNKLQPQAINLLLDKFPSFAAGAKAGEIGKEIGLYIYYNTGDKDGDPAHEAAGDENLAYVSGKYCSKSDGMPRYGYMIAVNAGSLADKQTVLGDGRRILVREGTPMNNLENTIVHELLHALMDDYNRTGMAGAVKASDAITDFKHISDAQFEVWKKVHYPLWFIEGTASSVENVFQYRLETFKVLMQENERGAACSKAAIHWNYFTGKLKDDFLYFPLSYADHDGEKDPDGDIIDADASRYVTGYLAVLYLGELAARKDSGIGTSIGTNANGLTVFASEKIRLGLDSIFARLHKGETLDQVIADISPYKDTADFEGKFIQGAVEERDNERYYVFDDSTQFVSDFLYFMNVLKNDDDFQYYPNGSILFPFHRDFTTPLDRTKEAESDCLKIVESNTYVDSTAPDSVALAGGGKSEFEPSLQGAASEATTDGLPMAAKASAEEGTAASQGDEPTAEASESGDVAASDEGLVAPEEGDTCPVPEPVDAPEEPAAPEECPAEEVGVESVEAEPAPAPVEPAPAEPAPAAPAADGEGDVSVSE